MTEAEFLEIKKNLVQHGQMDCRVVSDSMEPLIMTNEVVIIKPLITEPKRFDILVFWNGQNLICHYLTYKNQLLNESYSTRPLKYKGEDLPVEKRHVLGQVVNKKISFIKKCVLVFQ